LVISALFTTFTLQAHGKIQPVRKLFRMN